MRNMAEVTRRFGNLTIRFLGDNANQFASAVDSAYGRSPSFRAEIANAATIFKDFYVGGSRDDLASVPNSKNVAWNRVPEGATAYGGLGAPDTYFFVVTGAEHNLVQGDQSFPGTAELTLVHELLHPMQLMRDFAETGVFGNPNAEIRVQMREQRIAEELGYEIGKTFPDVLGTGTPYQVISPEADPLIHPMRYGAPTGDAPVLPGPQMAPQQVPATSASPIDVPVPPALQPLVPFFFPQGLNTRSTRAWPSTGAADGSDTPGLYNGPLPPALSSPSGPFGGALMPGGPFAPPQPNQASDGGALAAFPSQTQMVPQQAPAPASIEARSSFRRASTTGEPV
jgi:hypothetical protein